MDGQTERLNHLSDEMPRISKWQVHVPRFEKLEVEGLQLLLFHLVSHQQMH